MKNSFALFDIAIKDGKIAVGHVNLTGAEELAMKVSLYEAPAGPAAAATILTVADVLDSLSDAGRFERVSVMVSDNVILRFASALKARKEGVDIAERMLQGWMVDPVKTKEAVDREAWKESIEAFAGAFTTFLDGGGTVNFVSVRRLYRWEILGDISEDMNGLEVTFANGVDEKHGLVCRENGMLAGKYTLEVVKSVAWGKTTYRAFVPHMLSVRTEDGDDIKRVPAVEVAGDFTVEGSNSSTATVLNALHVHVKTVERLPRVKTIKKLNVEVSEG